MGERFVFSSGNRLTSSPETVAFVTYILTSLMPELQFVFIPAGILILLPVSFSCRATTVPTKPEFGMNDDEAKVEQVEQKRNGSSSRDKLSNGNGFSHSHSSLAERAVKKARSRNRVNHSDDDDDAEDANMIKMATTTIVAADIHQRLSRSQTTIV